MTPTKEQRRAAEEAMRKIAASFKIETSEPPFFRSGPSAVDEEEMALVRQIFRSEGMVNDVAAVLASREAAAAYAGAMGVAMAVEGSGAFWSEIIHKCDEHPAYFIDCDDCDERSDNLIEAGVARDIMAAARKAAAKIKPKGV